MKRKADNSYKARLVAQGWNQVHGLDCGSTFAPVATERSNIRGHLRGIRLGHGTHGRVNCLSVRGHPGESVNGTGTWLRGQGQGWRRASHAAFTGWPKAPGTGSTPSTLADIGFVPLKSDTCVYVYNHEGVKIILTLYVDDLLLTGNNAEAVVMVKSQL